MSVVVGPTALEIMRAPKQSRRRQSAAKQVLRELSNNGTTLKLLSGRYGPYVTDGTTNASIPKGTNPESLTFEQAVELLEARRNAAPSPKRGGFGRAKKGSRPKAQGSRSKATA